jgi:sigma54-dependent transcription regulator
MAEGSCATSTEAGIDRRARVRVPGHVVHRSFPTETVVLNLETGIYHGLNPTAGRMLETLEQAETIGRAAALLAAEFGQPRSLVERDLCELCRALRERGLVAVDAAA